MKFPLFKGDYGLAKANHIVYQFIDRNKLNELSGGKNHQGVLLFAAAGKYCEIDDLLAKAKEAGEPPFLLLLDEIQDPHNFGAIIQVRRMAVGVHGIIIPKRRSVPLTGTVAKTSAGASAHVPIARVSNLAAAIDTLKEAGLWIAGTDLSGKHSVLRSRFQRTDRNRDRAARETGWDR